MNVASSMGTVISEMHCQRIHNMVKRSSGTVLLGGESLEGTSELDAFDLSKGSFYAPTIVTNVETTDELWQEEVFGPVVVLKKFSVSSHSFSLDPYGLVLIIIIMIMVKNEEEGIRLANDSKYGLGAGLWTNDLSRAHRVAEEVNAGLVWVNTHHRNDPSSPWSVS